MTNYCVIFRIQNSILPDKVVLCAKEELTHLKKGDVVEIDFPEYDKSASYKIVDIEEKWSLDDKGNDTYWFTYIVKLVSGSLKKIKS